MAGFAGRLVVALVLVLPSCGGSSPPVVAPSPSPTVSASPARVTLGMETAVDEAVDGLLLLLDQTPDRPSVDEFVAARTACADTNAAVLDALHGTVSMTPVRPEYGQVFVQATTVLHDAVKACPAGDYAGDIDSARDRLLAALRMLYA